MESRPDLPKLQVSQPIVSLSALMCPWLPSLLYGGTVSTISRERAGLGLFRLARPCSRQSAFDGVPPFKLPPNELGKVCLLKPMRSLIIAFNTAPSSSS